MSASSNAFKASRTEDNDNHAAVANIKGQYLLLYIQRIVATLRAHMCDVRSYVFVEKAL